MIEVIRKLQQIIMFVAIDIGGTKTDIGFYETKNLNSLEATSSLKTSQSFKKTEREIFIEISQKIGKNKIEGIGVSFAGIVDKNGQITQASNIPNFKSKPLKQNLEKEFNTTTFIIQDSPCSAIAELVYGKINEFSRVVHLIIGTGLGGSFLEINKDKTIISPIEPCGLIVDVKNGRTHKFNKTTGLLEAYVGGGNIEDFYKSNLADVKDNDPIWNEITDYLAVGINNLNCILKPEVVVIGGGIGLKRKKALQDVVKKVQRFSEFVEPPKIEFTQVEGNSSLVGALAVNFVPNLVLNT